MLDPDRITTKALRLLLVFISIFGVAAIGISLQRIGGSLTLSYLPNGVAVAVTYRFGRRVWPAVFLAGVAIILWTHQPLVAGIGVGIGLASGAWASAWLLERSGFDRDFSRAKDVPPVTRRLSIPTTNSLPRKASRSRPTPAQSMRYCPSPLAPTPTSRSRPGEEPATTKCLPSRASGTATCSVTVGGAPL